MCATWCRLAAVAAVRALAGAVVVGVLLKDSLLLHLALL
jgi:hypothetical protein